MSRLAADIAGLVDEELRAFNVERVYATDRTVTRRLDRRSRAAAADDGVASRRHRCCARRSCSSRSGRARRKRHSRRKTKRQPRDVGRARGLRACAGAIDGARPRRVGRRSQPPAVQAAAEDRHDRRMLGARRDRKDARVDPRQVARQAEGLVKQAAAEAGQQIEPAAARLVAERAGTDIATLRGDVERLMLYAAGSRRSRCRTRREVVSAESSQDDWAVTNGHSAGAMPPRRCASWRCRWSRAACPT